MLFKDLFVAPPAGPVDLDDEGFRVLDTDLVHAVFITVQGQ